MDREDVISMAREAGLERNGYWEFDLVRLERFTNLVAAAEREALLEGAKVSIPTDAMEQQFAVYHRRGYKAGKALIPAAVAAEREACAQVCDDWPTGRDDIHSIGVAIRARGDE
jgi:hypothetical protein